MTTLIENDPSLWLDAFPWPKPDGHKYQRGHVLVLGSDTLTGAGRLTARAALRVGAGLVTIAAPVSSYAIYAQASLSIMVRPIKDLAGFEALMADPRHTVMAIGPGLEIGERQEGQGDIRAYVNAVLKTKRMSVLDAGALTAFAAAPQDLFDAISAPCVMTPHEGEFARLFAIEGDRLTRALRAAKLSGAIMVLKGKETLIATPDGRAIINKNAPPNLATAGTGDVLTGLIAGLLAQGLEPWRAAACGVWLHAEGACTFGAGLIAEDLPEVMPMVLKALMMRAF